MDIAEQLMLKIERFGDKHPLNVADEMTRLTLDTIALCAFDYRFNSFYNDKMHPFIQSMVDHLIEAGKIALRPSIQKPFMLASNRRYREQMEYMSQVADEVIAERKIHPTDKKDLSNGAKNPYPFRVGDESERSKWGIFVKKKFVDSRFRLKRLSLRYDSKSCKISPVSDGGTMCFAGQTYWMLSFGV